mgnify:FL=1
MGHRQYLHAYTDTPPDDAFLVAKLHESPSHDAVGATFSLARPNAIDDSVWALIESHFARLHLLERYNEQGNDEIAEILSNSYNYMDTGGQNIREFLTREAADREGAHGKSHWRAVLLRAMAEHDHLESWIAAARHVQGST